MPYTNVIDRVNDAAALIPTQTSQEIIKNLSTTNPLLSMARRLRNMTGGAMSMPVQSAFATAYFVNGDTGLKQTTEVDWTGVNVHAEELAAIVPIPQSVLDDIQANGYDAWAEIRPEIEAALGVAIAQAVLYGTNIPANWTTDLGAAGIVARCTAAGHTISMAAYTDAYEAILGHTAAGVLGLYMLPEADGFGVNGNLAHISMKGILRNTRDTNGLPIFKTNMQDASRYELDGARLFFPDDGSIVAATSLMVSGDWSKLVYSMRQEITYTIATEGVIQDATGAIVYNLFQQDMVALRAVMRLGFALPNPINRMNATALTRCPFATLTV
jgi:HK97 family phage major capsid protein